MESKTTEQQYNEVKVVHLECKEVDVHPNGSDYQNEGIKLPTYWYEYPGNAAAIATYLKDGWSIISFTTNGSGESITLLLGR